MRIVPDAIRRVFRQPRLLVAMAAVLAVGFAASFALSGSLNLLVFRPLPYPSADRLATAALGARVWSPAMLDAVSAANSTFDAMAGVQERAVHVQAASDPLVLRLEAVSGIYFDMLGVRAAEGRVLSVSDDANAPERVCVVSDSLRRRAFGEHLPAVGHSIALDGTPVSIVGVLPGDFAGLIGRTDVWIPLRLADQLGTAGTAPPRAERPFSRSFEVIARIRPGLTWREAGASFELDARRAMAGIPGADTALGRGWRATLTPLHEAASDSRTITAAMLLVAAVWLVVLLASVNFASVHVARMASRTREFAIRRALGASARDLAALIGVETGCAVVLGLTLGWAGHAFVGRALMAIRPEVIGFGIRTADPTARGSGVDAAVLLAHVGVAVVCWAMATLLPAWRASRVTLEPLLRGSVHRRSLLPKPGRLNAAGVLIALQIGVSVAVVGAAGLMVRTAYNISTAERGVDARGVRTMRLQLPGRYDQRALADLLPAVAREVAAIPGVAAASLANCAPGAGRCRQTNVRAVDARLVTGADAPTVGVHFATAAHFDVLGTRLIAGRGFREEDRAGGPPAAIVSEALATRLWGSIVPLGRQFALHFADGANTEPREVIGIVRDIQYDPRKPGPQLDVYLPAAQAAWSSPMLFVKPTGAGATLDSIRRSVGRVDLRVAVYDVKPLTERLGASFTTERFILLVLAAFASISLLLAGIGVYALVGHALTDGEREGAIRLALGARPRRLALAAAVRTGQLIVAGTVLGVAALAASGRWTSIFLHGVPSLDPASLAAAVGLVAAAGAVAAAIPLRRLARLDPAALLR